MGLPTTDTTEVGAASPEEESDSAPSRVGRSFRLADWLPFGTAVVVTIWVFRATIFTGDQIGNIGDARWSIGLHEHWFQVWQGNESFRNLSYYFPLTGTLGTSEPFFLQGQIYSVARLLGLSLLRSWSIAQIAFFLIGAVGGAVLSRLLFSGVWARVAFVLLTCASYPMLVEMGHPQMIGFLSTSWLFVGAGCLVRDRPRTGLALLAVGTPVLALSCWYAIVMLAIVVCVLGVVVLVLTPWGKVRAVVARGWRNVSGLHWLWWVGSAAGLLGGMAVVAWVFLPGAALLPPPGWFEVVLYGPRWSDLVNASAGGGGVWAPLYDSIFPAGSYNTEQNRGFTPILLCAIIGFGLYQLRCGVNGGPARPELDGRPGRISLIASFLTIPAVLAIFLVDERGLGLFNLIWATVPGMTSIRVTMRVQVLLFGFAAFLIIRSLELAWRREDRSWQRWSTIARAAFATLLLAAIFVEMQRPVEASWDGSDLLPVGVANQAEAVRANCETFILFEETDPDRPWRTAGDAVILSAVTGVPTAQGLSRADPVGYPGLSDDGTALVNWMRGLGYSGSVCRVSPDGVSILAE